MSQYFVGFFALLVAAAGWFYLFNSKAAEKLSVIEDQSLNARRIRLRRVGGFLMIVLALTLYAGVNVVSWEQPTIWFALTWIFVLFLLALITILALVDLRLTTKLRRSRKREQP